MIKLEWNQVHAGRLARHHLLQRAGRQDFLTVVSDICCLQAQVMSSAELALWARVDGLAADDVENALWRERSLVKSWAMRGTLHLVTAADFPLYVAALSPRRPYRRQSWLKYFNVTLDEMEAMIAGIGHALGEQGLTREQVADAVVGQMGKPHLRPLMVESWGGPLKPAAYQGHLCFGPSQGQKVTFVRPAHWLGNWQVIEPAEAQQEIVRRYLAAYGPATADDFRRWFGSASSEAKKLLRSLGDEIVTVEVEGQPAWALTASLQQLDPLPTSPIVRLLPAFDPYTFTLYRQPGVLLSEANWPRVSRPQGWISPVVLLDGRIEGVWDYKKQRTATQVTVEMFAPVDETVQSAIELEAGRLGEFFGTPTEFALR